MASGLTEAELDRMRSTVQNTVLPGTAIILGQSKVSDGMGGYTNSYVASGTIAARLDYKGGEGDESDISGRLAEHKDYILTIPNGTTIEETGRVEFDGAQYEVRSVLVRGPWDLCERVELAKVE